MHKLTLKILIVIAVALAAGRLVVSNSISTSGIALSEINGKIADYKFENDNLSEKLFSISSLSVIASEAARLGFSYKAEKFILTTFSTFAKR